MPSLNKDTEHIDALRDYFVRNRRIPSHQRIAELMGFVSRAASSKLLERLAAAGFIERTPDNDAWIPTRRFFERPLANTAVRAGAPDEIEGNLSEESLLIDDYLVQSPSTTVMVPIKGDSMIDAGIHEGDIAVVDRRRAAKAGDFVIAIVDQEFTLKELRIERGRFVLKPHNPDYSVIRPKGELEIYGVVTGLIRRYPS